MNVWIAASGTRPLFAKVVKALDLLTSLLEEGADHHPGILLREILV